MGGDHVEEGEEDDKAQAVAHLCGCEVEDHTEGIIGDTSITKRDYPYLAWDISELPKYITRLTIDLAAVVLAYYCISVALIQRTICIDLAAFD